jgi:hypothetical protein
MTRIKRLMKLDKYIEIHTVFSKFAVKSGLGETILDSHLTNHAQF